jgi:hypothetical protein
MMEAIASAARSRTRRWGGRRAWVPVAGTGALFVLAALMSAVTLRHGINLHDEGVMLQAAARLADGQLPYRDFWWIYGPGQPLLLGGLWEVFGPSLAVWRVVAVLLDAAIGLLAYRLVRREASRGWALAAWLAAATAVAWPAVANPNAPALALGLGAVLAARRWPGGAGALAGLAIVFRLELGLAAAVGAVIAAGRPGAARTAVATTAVAAAGWAPFVIADPGAVLDQTLGFVRIQDLQRLPFPLEYHGGADPNKLLEFYFPAVLVAGLALWVGWVAVRRAPRADLAFAPLAAVGLAYLLGRTDEFHYVPLSVVLAILLAGAAAREEAAAVRGGLALVLALLVLHGLDRVATQVVHPPRLTALALPAADGVRVDPAEARALRDLATYVDAKVPPGTPILVAPPQFDRVRISAPLLFVLLDRPNPTRYDGMQPGIVTEAAGQREMIADLERARLPLIVRWVGPEALEREPNGSGRSSGVRLLDRWLSARYRRAARFGPYLVLARWPGP